MFYVLHSNETGEIVIMVVRTVALLGFLLGSLGLAADPTDAERLAKSLAAWMKAKEECGGNYSYKVVKASFTGFRSETTIVVKGNKVVERRLETATP
ncbi:MAG: hypothetical protein NZM29_01485, partial [Nitrospira sp.]|nr:hypothetical protein [Nitrospira sp.]